MKHWVQTPTPWDRSVHWLLHDAWFAARGTAAWDDGDVPFEATSNHAAAMVHAAFLLELVEQLEAAGELSPAEPVAVLEAGGGNGDFAVNMLRVLEVGFGDAGRRLRRRLRWVWSDYQARTVREACLRPGLRHAVDEGLVVPAVFDLRDVDSLQALDGSALPERWVAVYGNYLACVVATRVLRWSPQGVFELCVGLRAEVADEQEAEALREGWLADPTRDDLLEDLDLDWSWQRAETGEPGLDTLRNRLPSATVSWPVVFLGFVAHICTRLRPGGVVVVSDFGTASEEEVVGLQEPRPRHYGNTSNLGVDFVVFEAMAEALDLGLLRTLDPLRSVHNAVFFASSEHAEATRPLFQRHFLDQRPVEDWLDFSEAAEAAEDEDDDDETLTAMRWWERCARLAPYDPEVHLKLGELAIDAELYVRAERSLHRCLELDIHERYDAPFHLARLCSLTERLVESVQWYRRSLEQEDHPIAWSNLGGVYEELDELQEAVDCYRRALSLDPSHRRSRKRLNALT